MQGFHKNWDQFVKNTFIEMLIYERWAKLIDEKVKLFMDRLIMYLMGRATATIIGVAAVHK
jgi:hypothetical protein